MSHGGDCERSCLPRRSGNDDASGTKVLSNSLSLGSKIKSRFDRGASVNLESTSTWIGMIGKSSIPTEKSVSLYILITCLLAIACDS
jgi:hypothetical protein